MDERRLITDAEEIQTKADSTAEQRWRETISDTGRRLGGQEAVDIFAVRATFYACGRMERWSRELLDIFLSRSPQQIGFGIRCFVIYWGCSKVTLSWVYILVFKTHMLETK